MNCVKIGELQCEGHSEADTMIVRYSLCASSSATRIVVRADDADIFFLLLQHAHLLVPVMMDLGLSSRNNRRCVNISQLAKSLGPEVG